MLVVEVSVLVVVGCGNEHVGCGSERLVVEMSACGCDGTKLCGM